MSTGNPSPQESNGALSPSTSVGATSSYPESPQAATNSSIKKRKVGSGNRGVANLTPEKLAKKRANDREAQRAIRERTRHQIESLEQKIAELTSQQPYQELQNVLHEKRLVELENAEIKSRLATVLDLIQPLLSGEFLSNVSVSPPAAAAALSHNSANGYEHHTRNLHVESPLPSLDILGHSHASGGIDPSMRRPPSSGIDQRETFDRGRPELHNNTTAEERRHSGFVHSGSHLLSRSHLLEHHRPSPIIHTALPADHHITLPSPITKHHLHGPGIRHGHERESRQPWECVPSWIANGEVFDNLLLEFTLAAQRQRSQGGSEYEILGPRYPNFAAITYPNRKIPCHAMSSFLRDILMPFPDSTIVANKVAIAYVMSLILRWFIFPTPENFDRLPPWVRPNSWQLAITHAIWIDFVPWPDMRTEMVRNQHRYPFDRFFIPHSKTESLNWDHGEAAIYAPAPAPAPTALPSTNTGTSTDRRGSHGHGSTVEAAADGDSVLSQAYEAHIRNLDNWTLGPAFAKEFPLLAAGCRISTRGEDERRELMEARGGAGVGR